MFGSLEAVSGVYGAMKDLASGGSDGVLSRAEQRLSEGQQEGALAEEEGGPSRPGSSEARPFAMRDMGGKGGITGPSGKGSIRKYVLSRWDPVTFGPSLLKVL